jgi:hypothetical protein
MGTPSDLFRFAGGDVDKLKRMVAYLVMYKLRGFGAYGSGSYVDPVGEPGRFLLSALVRVPVLLSGLVMEVPADLWLARGLRPVLVAR